MPVTFLVSPVDVANEALGMLGRPPITDLDSDTDPIAVQARLHFGSALRAMLRDHIWNFAHERRALAANAVAPISEFTTAFALPDNCFRVLSLNNSTQDIWRIEGRNLVTNYSTATIEYIKWVDDPNLWDGKFHEAFVTLLASKLAAALNTDNAKSSDLYNLYMAQLIDAKAVDGQESSNETVVCTTLTDDIRE